MSTYRLPGDPAIVTDVDPDDVVWATGNVTAEPIEGFDGLTAEPGQTHTTTGLLGVDAGLNETRKFRVFGTRGDAVAMLDPTCPVDPDDWQTYALVPAQVVEGLTRPRGEAWSDLVSALVLVAGRVRPNPLWCEHDVLHLCADPADFDATELAQLDAWGFIADSDGGFSSFRFGSA